MTSTESIPKSEPPKVFISYSWSSSEHEQWVLQLATELRESSVDVILDKWDLREGNDANAFMERMVADPDIKKVVLVCDKRYAEKADKRAGGVGTEAQIISPEIYEKTDQNKFVAVIAEKDEKGKPYVPIYYKSRVYIDLSDSEQYAKNFEQLLRWVFDRPMYVKPELGSKPGFLEDTIAISLGTTSRFSRSIEAIRNGRPYAQGAIQDYFDTFTANLENFRVVAGEKEFDDIVIDNIELFRSYRNEAIELFAVLAQYSNIRETHGQLHRFFENLIPYLSRPEGVQNYKGWGRDNFKFIIHELFLYCVAALLRHEAFDGVEFLLGNRYYVGDNPDHGTEDMQSFILFRPFLEIFNYRNKRLDLRRLSLHADIIKQRSIGSGVNFEQLMQADFVSFLRNCVETINGTSRQHWWPVTLLYKEDREQPFEIFARAESSRYLESIIPMLGITTKDDLRAVLEAFQSGKLRVPTWEYVTIHPNVLMNYDKLATRK